MGSLPSLLRRRSSVFLVATSIAFFFANVLLISHHISDSHHNVEQAVEKSNLVSHVCNLNEALVKSALSRAKTSVCRQKIEDAACRLQNGTLYPKFPQATCANYDETLVNVEAGCFFDAIKNRLLKGHEYKFPDAATPEMCRLACQRAGFIYYGVEFGHECFCDNELSGNATTVAAERCTKYPCPGDSKLTCGGYQAVHVFRTGIKEKVDVRKSSYVSINETAGGEPVRILFLLQFNGRNIRQVTRLLKAIYSPQHLYYIHVDSRQTYMHHEMKQLVTKLSSMGIQNVWMAKNRWASIWGGASLLHMVLDAIRSTTHEKWDFFLNLSESDFPILTMEELEAQLQTNRGTSFVASHGHNTARFIEKQGFEYAFFECESHMWRVGKRKDFGFGLRLDGGSDWIVITREFAEFAISSSALPSALRQAFESVILPVESFFHTLAKNSEFCDKVTYGNLRLTNWNRKQGCRCASLKKVVDWCGCSPLVYRQSTASRFALDKAKSKAAYFSRKFESLVDVTPIQMAEEQAFRDRPQVLSTGHKSFQSVHVSFFKAEVDEYSEPLSRLAASLFTLHDASRVEAFSRLRAVEVFKARRNAPLQLVLEVDTQDAKVMELLVERRTRGEVFDTPVVDGFQLQSIHFGMQIDHKEEIFRNYPALLTTTGTAEVLLSWTRVSSMRSSVSVNKTSPSVDISWRSPSGSLNHSTLAPYDSFYGSQFTSFDLSALESPESGVWSVLIHDSSQSLIAKAEFPVFDIMKEEEFDRLASQFYKVVNVCTVGENCEEEKWSSHFPDPKAQVLSGYNASLRFLT